MANENLTPQPGGAPDALKGPTPDATAKLVGSGNTQQPAAEALPAPEPKQEADPAAHLAAPNGVARQADAETTDEASNLEQRLAEIRADAMGATHDLAPKLKVELPHAAFTFGGVTVTTDFAKVPPHVVAGLLEAARDAGVTITQEG
jgi:hypothetical protein